MYWDLKIKVPLQEPVKTKKSSDNCQNVRIMIAVLGFKNGKNYASTIYKSLPAHRDQLALGRKAINVSFEEFKGWFSLATESESLKRL